MAKKKIIKRLKKAAPHGGSTPKDVPPGSVSEGGPDRGDDDQDNGEEEVEVDDDDDPEEGPGSGEPNQLSSVPNHFSVVQKVYDSQHYDLTTKLGCGSFLEDTVAALHAVDPKWGHLEKMPGQNQWNGHAVDAALYFSQGQTQAVDLITAGESTDAKIGWNPDIPRPEYAARWYAPTGGNSFVLPPHQTRLGCSLFWLMAGTKNFRVQLEANLKWVKETLHADYIRAFAVVGGDEFPTSLMQAEPEPSLKAAIAAMEILDGAVPYQATQMAMAGPKDSRADPWQFAGSFLSWPDYDKVFLEAHALAASYGLKVAWTFVGGRAQVPTAQHQLLLVDRLCNLLSAKGVLETTEFVEMWNEYNVTGGQQAEIRAMADRTRQRLGHGVLIALDTPASAMESPGEHGDPLPAEVTQFYKGSSADVITPQWCRSEPNPRNMGADAPGKWVSHEPRGPGASAGGDTADPLYLADDYQQMALKKAYGNTSHWKAGVWGGHCHPAWPRENATANIFDHDHAKAIATALATVRAGGTVRPGKVIPPDIGEPDVPIPPYDEPWIMNTVRPAVMDVYAKHNRPLDDQYPVWCTRTQYDYNAGTHTQQASLDKHLKELDAHLSA